METVNRLTEWGDKPEAGCQEVVKTVSRMVQSFEHVAINNMLNEINEHQSVYSSYDFKNFLEYDNDIDAIDNSERRGERGRGHGGNNGKRIRDSRAQEEPRHTISSVANSFRRSNAVYHRFATLVAAEITLANFLSGQRNIQVIFKIILLNIAIIITTTNHLQ